MADRLPDLSGYMHDGKFWKRAHQRCFNRQDRSDPCYLCGWGPMRGIHGVPDGTEPHGELGLHSFRRSPIAAKPHPHQESGNG